MGAFTNLINSKQSFTEDRFSVYSGVSIDDNGKLVFDTRKPIIDPNLKISAPTGKELTLEQLPENIKNQEEAKIRESNLQLSGKDGENFLQIVARAPFRAAQATALDYINPQGGSQMTPKTNFEKFIFGEEPVQSLSKQYEEQKKTSGLPGAVVGLAVFGGAILDLTPAGGEDDVLKNIIKINNLDDAFKLGRKIGVSDDLLVNFAEGVVKTKTKTAAKNLVSYYDDLIKATTKTAAAGFDEAVTPLSSNLRNFERAKNLTPEGRIIEEKAFKKIIGSENEILAQYTAKYGKDVNPDNFRPFFADVGYVGVNAADVQEPASYLGKKAYTQNLKNPEPYALFTSGGSGAGKSSALDGLPDYVKAKKRSAVILDTNLSTYDSAIKKISEAEEAGKKPIFFYVYREPTDALENGVIKRMRLNPEEMNRIVPNDVIAKNTIGSWEVAKKLYDQNYDVHFIDNSLGFGKAKKISFEQMSKKVNLPPNLESIFDDKVKQLLNKGTITPEEYSKFVEKTTTAANVGATTTKAKAVERGFVTSAKQVVPKAEKIAGQYVSRSTDDLAIAAKNLIKESIDTAENLALHGTDDRAVATASELLKHYADEAEKAVSPAAKNALYDKAAEVANTIAPKLTEQGRSIQAASILGRLTPEGQVRFAASQIAKYNEGVKISKQIPNLTGTQTKYILDEMKAIGKMADSVEKAIKFQKLQDYITKLVPTPLFKKWIAVWKAGLLTGLKTTGVNIFANTSHFFTETIKDIPATIVDKVVSLFTGKRSVTFNLKKSLSGVSEGAGKGWRYLTTGFDERNIATKLDYTKVNFGEGKLAQGLQKYTDTVFRIMGTEDQPFYYASKLRSLYEQAKVGAINKGLKGAKAQSFIDDLMKAPTEQMIKYASLDAETAVFQNQTILSKAASGITRAVPAAEIIIPFRRTPSAVAMQILNYSPAGVVKPIYNAIKNGQFDQRLFSQAIGRGLTGTAAIFLGMELYKKGLITGARPTGEREQKQWEAEGKQANSIKFGNKWRQIQVLGPIGNLLIIGGVFQKNFDNSGSPTEAMSKSLAESSQAFSQQTFLTGVSNFISAVSDPARSASYVAGSTLASTIPTFISDVARATDTVERRTQSILDRFMLRLPGGRQMLQPQVDIYGNERETQGNPLEIMIDPTRPTNVKTNLVIEEIKRLGDAGYKVSPTLLGDKNGYKILTPEQNTQLWKRAGEIIGSKLNNLFNYQPYIDLSDADKANIIDNFVDKSKTAARAEMVIQLTQGLEGQALTNRLSELKKAGFLTREVYNLYIEIK